MFIAAIFLSGAVAQEVKFERFVDLSIIPTNHKVEKGEIIPRGKATAWKINNQLVFTTASHIIQQESLVEIWSLDGKKCYGWAKIIGNIDSSGICVFILDTAKTTAPQQSFMESAGLFKASPFSIELPHLETEIIFRATLPTCTHYLVHKIDCKFNLDKGDSGMSDIGWDEGTGEWYIFVFQSKVYLSKSGMMLDFTRIPVRRLEEIINQSAY